MYTMIGGGGIASPASNGANSAYLQHQPESIREQGF